MRHGRGALLLFAEVLLRLAHLGALQVADFDGDFVERTAEDGQRGDVGGVPVALDDLRGHGRGLEAEPRADALLVLRLEMAERADGARQLAHAHVFGGGIEAGHVALHLGVPVQQLEAEGGGFGVDAVGAADGGRVLELEGAALENGEEGYDADADEGGRFFHLERLGRIDNVVGRQAVVQPARLGVQALVLQAFCHSSREGDDVVLHLRFDLLHAGGGDSGNAGDGCGGGGRNHAILGENLAGRRFHLQPAAVFVLVRPDAAHRRACVAFDQRLAPGCQLLATSSILARSATFESVKKLDTRMHAHGLLCFGPTLDCTRLTCYGARDLQAAV